jgi:hypothetical protein
MPPAAPRISAALLCIQEVFAELREKLPSNDYIEVLYDFSSPAAAIDQQVAAQNVAALHAARAVVTPVFYADFRPKQRAVFRRVLSSKHSRCIRVRLLLLFHFHVCAYCCLTRCEATA